VKKKSKYVFGSLFFVLSIILFIKFIELRNVVFDGDGIGIYLLGFEINDRVPNGQVITYANGFLIASLLFLIPIIYNSYKSFKQKSA
jgi:hypothetical protein